MADFERAFEKTMGHEGGYSNDPDDAGGETYRGISRVYHPSWDGWDFIDYSNQGGNKIDDAFMKPFVLQFYKQHYWDVNRCGEMPQQVAEEMFDTGVNMGVVKAGEFLQKALNCLNRNGMLFADLVVDGNVGPKTLRAMSTLLTTAPMDVLILLKIMNVLQGMHYIEYMVKSPTQEKYARGWFSRVTLDK